MPAPIKTTAVRLFRRPRSSRLQVEIDLPVDIRRQFMSHPAVANLGFKVGTRGRIRRSLGQLSYADAKTLVETWKRIIAIAEAGKLTRQFCDAICKAYHAK